ncbi:hypothetical protein M9H77_25578 [Catharanthus roseus]|uniref:Uncharacterized protein n=1 Tax=Catharanthus roseus TaxID=4058 RepID=A0ACC0A7C0_CATRO|nr:hypothetical protein M9H77_25578 [Catharanthus roseus]
MGNCIRRLDNSSMVWAAGVGDDEWESAAVVVSRYHGIGNYDDDHIINGEKQGLLVDHHHHHHEATGGGGSREIKIKITKKQLEELVGRAADQKQDPVLSRLIYAGQRCEFLSSQRSWRPRLQSIPEVN